LALSACVPLTPFEDIFRRQVQKIGSVIKAALFKSTDFDYLNRVVGSETQQEIKIYSTGSSSYKGKLLTQSISLKPSSENTELPATCTWIFSSDTGHDEMTCTSSIEYQSSYRLLRCIRDKHVWVLQKTPPPPLGSNKPQGVGSQNSLGAALADAIIITAGLLEKLVLATLRFPRNNLVN